MRSKNQPFWPQLTFCAILKYRKNNNVNKVKLLTLEDVLYIHRFIKKIMLIMIEFIEIQSIISS